MVTMDVRPPQTHKVRRIQLDQLNSGMKKSMELIAKIVLESRGVLDLQIRSNYCNLYYSGGSQWRVSNISPRSRGMQIHTDKKYFKRKSGNIIDNSWLPAPKDSLNNWIDSLIPHQEILDGWFDEHPNPERKFQHELAVHHVLNEQSDWVILDVEYAAWLHGKKSKKKDKLTRRVCKYDLIGVKRNDLMSSNPLDVFIMELKQGNKSLQGSASLTSHAEDMEQLIFDKSDLKARDALVESIQHGFSEKKALGLLPNSSTDIAHRKINLRPAFVLKNVDPNQKFIDQKSASLEILSACDSEVLWLDYDEMVAR